MNPKIYLITGLMASGKSTVVLCPDVETIKERERYREKTGYSGFTVETLYDTFMQTTPRIGFWLDNSNQTPQQTAETILNARKPV